MPSPDQRVGAHGEDIALRWYTDQGFTFVDRNVHSRYGELDLVLEQGNTLLIVEVKHRRTATFGQAIEAVSQQKLQRLRRAIDDLVEHRGWSDKDLRVDVLTIDGQDIKQYSHVELPAG